MVVVDGPHMERRIEYDPESVWEGTRGHLEIDDGELSTMVYERPDADFEDRIDRHDSSSGYVDAGDERTATVSLDPSADVVSLQSGQTITVALVDGSPLVTVTTTVK